MNYEDAFNKMIAAYGKPVLSDTFLVRSILLDYIGSSIIDTQLVNAYSLLNRSENLFTYINKHSLDESKNHIKALIVMAPRHLSVDQYIESIEPLLFLHFPNQYVKRKTKCSGPQVAVVAKNKSNNPPLSLVSKPQVVNKQKPIQKPVVQKVIDSISISGVCKELLIDYGSTDISVYKNNKNITKSAISVVRNGTCYIKIKGKYSHFKIMLPNNYYKKIRINIETQDIDFACGRGHVFSLGELEIKTGECSTHISTNANLVSVNQDKGSTVYGGYIKEGRFALTKERVHCNFKSQKAVCNVTSIKKDVVDVEYISYRVKPKINHFLKKIKKVKGYYHLGNQPIKLDILTENGKIYVH